MTDIELILGREILDSRGNPTVEAEVILASQRVEPEAAVRAGFEFRYPEIGSALIRIVEG